MSSDGNGFTAKEILIDMDKKIDRILVDHETRLRGSEAAIYRLKGALFLVVVLIPLGVALIVTYGPKR